MKHIFYTIFLFIFSLSASAFENKIPDFLFYTTDAKGPWVKTEFGNIRLISQNERIQNQFWNSVELQIKPDWVIRDLSFINPNFNLIYHRPYYTLSTDFNLKHNGLIPFLIQTEKKGDTTFEVDIKVNACQGDTCSDFIIPLTLPMKAGLPRPSAFATAIDMARAYIPTPTTDEIEIFTTPQDTIQMIIRFPQIDHNLEWNFLNGTDLQLTQKEVDNNKMILTFKKPTEIPNEISVLIKHKKYLYIHSSDLSQKQEQKIIYHFKTNPLLWIIFFFFNPLFLYLFRNISSSDKANQTLCGNAFHYLVYFCPVMMVLLSVFQITPTPFWALSCCLIFLTAVFIKPRNHIFAYSLLLLISPFPFIYTYSNAIGFWGTFLKASMLITLPYIFGYFFPSFLSRLSGFIEYTRHYTFIVFSLLWFIWYVSFSYPNHIPQITPDQIEKHLLSNEKVLTLSQINGSISGLLSYEYYRIFFPEFKIYQGEEGMIYLSPTHRFPTPIFLDSGDYLKWMQD